jgi:hypothetical protein
MKVKAGQLVGAANTLSTLGSQKMPAATAFRVSRLANKLQEIMKPYDEAYKSMVSKYGDLDEDKQMYKIRADCMNAFTSETEALNAEEVDLGDISLIKESDLNEVELTPVEANSILLLVE